MSNPNAVGSLIQPGARLIDGSDIIKILSGQVNFTGLSMANGNASIGPVLVNESSQDNIVAGTVLTAAGATQLYNEVNRVTTATANGQGVMLPPSSPGLTVMVVNHSGFSINVYGFNGGWNGLVYADSIDDNAALTGVVQMNGSVSFYTCTTAGNWYAEGIGSGFAGSFSTLAYIDGLVASPTQTLAGGTPITTSLVGFGTVANAGNSATLPAAKPGMQITVINETANSMQVFPNSAAEKTNAGAAGASVNVNNAAPTIFTCLTAGIWWTK